MLEIRYDSVFRCLAVFGDSGTFLQQCVQGFSLHCCLLKGDSLRYHEGKSFSTKDRDNDRHRGGNCAVKCKGAWWYSDCARSNLNGKYLTDHYRGYAYGMFWYHYKGQRTMKATWMMIRPYNYKP